MKFRVTGELVDRVARGDKAAIHGLLDASHRPLHNVLFRATGDRGRARELSRRAFKHVMGRLKEASEPETAWPAFLLDVARDAAFDGLSSDEYRDTVFAKARDLITEPVEVEQLPESFLDHDEMWGQDFDTGFKSALTPAQLLVLELVFIERCPIAQVAEALDVSENMLGGFIYTTFDALGGMGHLEHRDGCAPDLFLGIKICALEADPEGLAKLEADHSGCYSCLTVIRRCLKIIRLFQIDSRLAAKADPALIDEVAAVPARKAAPVVAPTGRPLPAVPVAAPPPSDGLLQRIGRLALAGAILTVFMFAALKMVDPSRFERRVADAPVEKKGPKVLGTFSNPFVANQPIHDGLVIQSAKNHKTDVVLEGGASLLMQPGSSVRVHEGRVELLKGKIGMVAPRGSPLAVEADAVKGTLDDAEMVVERDAGKSAGFAVLKGDVKLDAPGGPIKIDALRQARLDESTSRVSVVDIEGEQLAAARSALPAKGAAGGGGAGSGSSFAGGVASVGGAGGGASSGPAIGSYPAPFTRAGAGAGATGGAGGTGGAGSGSTGAGAGAGSATSPGTGANATPRGYKDYF